jgi:hypothetical protein
MTNSTRCRLIFGALLATACGNGDDLPTGTDSDNLPDVEVIGRSPSDGMVASPTSGNGGTSGSVGGGGAVPLGPDPVATRCIPPVGVSGDPQTIVEAIALMNAFPRPTSLECFLEALDRPLSLYLTSSALSLQPSAGPRSPRTFIIKGALAMSVVPDGRTSVDLEIGWRTSDARSIKSEIEFPLVADVSAARLFDRVQEGDRTKCGQCHSAETRVIHEDFPDGAFESEVLVPYSTLEVSVDSLLDETAACDPAAEPRRCSMLDAIYGHGAVVQSPLWLTQPLPL